MVDGADTFYTDWEETYESFDQMNLHENLLRGIYAYGEFCTDAVEADAQLLSGSKLLLSDRVVSFLETCSIREQHEKTEPETIRRCIFEARPLCFRI